MNKFICTIASMLVCGGLFGFQPTSTDSYVKCAIISPKVNIDIGYGKKYHFNKHIFDTNTSFCIWPNVVEMKAAISYLYDFEIVQAGIGVCTSYFFSGCTIHFGSSPLYVVAKDFGKYFVEASYLAPFYFNGGVRDIYRCMLSCGYKF